VLVHGDDALENHLNNHNNYTTKWGSITSVIITFLYLPTPIGILRCLPFSLALSCQPATQDF
ncbi:MAG: hypothetical protein AAGU16_02395, partial [Desulfitobacterium hafniense]